MSAVIFVSEEDDPQRWRRALAHEVMVIRRGRVVEQGPAEAVFRAPKEAYTRALMAAAFEMKADETGVVST